MKRRCADHACYICWPYEKTAGAWPWLALGLILLAAFVVFTVVWMTQGGAFRPEITP